jgi:putative oxidoreductase
MPETNRDALLLFCRFCLCYIFITSGWDKLMDPAGFAGHLGSAGVPAATLFAWVGIIAEFAGGVAILFGALTRFVAILYIPYLVAATLIGHRYWELSGGARVGSLTNFDKNLAMIGGYALLAYTGPGGWSVDALLGRTKVARLA